MRLYVRMQSNNTIKGRRGLRCGEALTPTRPRRLDVHRTPKRKARGRFYIVFKHISDKEILTESPWPPCWMWRQLQWTVLAHALGFSMRACQQQRGCLGPWAKIIQVLSPLSLCGQIGVVMGEMTAAEVLQHVPVCAGGKTHLLPAAHKHRIQETNYTVTWLNLVKVTEVLWNKTGQGQAYSSLLHCKKNTSEDVKWKWR